MTNRDCDGFWEGGHDAWWQGLTAAILSASARLKTAESDEERDEAQTALDQLKEQEADANRNSGRWLF